MVGKIITSLSGKLDSNVNKSHKSSVNDDAEQMVTNFFLL